jgi:hypothetical protein
MYKGKPLIIAKRPWWKHPIFPWGVYSLTMDRLSGDKFEADGYFTEKDGGAGVFEYKSDIGKSNHNGGTVIDPDILATQSSANCWSASGEGSGVWERQY